ncbi:MAG: DMT family transporter [Gammaproteobacteria bacterium]
MPAPQFFWMIFAALLFGVMGVCVKFAAARFGVLELVFYRSALGCVFTLAIARVWRKSLATSNLRVHLWRGVAGFTALALFFYALPKLHISTAMALLQTSPLFLAALAVLFLRERMSLPLAASLFAGFFGMLLALRPGTGGEDILAGCAAACAGAAAGCAYFNIRRLGLLNEGGVRTVFYFAAVSAVLSAVLLVFFGELSPINWTGAFWLLAVGATATAGQFALTLGLHYGRAVAASGLMYAGIIFAGIFEYVIWGGAPDAAAWAGFLMIMAGGIGAAYYGGRRGG